MRLKKALDVLETTVSVEGREAYFYRYSRLTFLNRVGASLQLVSKVASIVPTMRILLKAVKGNGMCVFMSKTVMATPEIWEAMHATERRMRRELLSMDPMEAQNEVSPFPLHSQFTQLNDSYPERIMEEFERESAAAMA